MSGCYLCGQKFTSTNGSTPIHVKLYNIDICAKCAKASKQRWQRMVAGIKGQPVPEKELVLE